MAGWQLPKVAVAAEEGKAARKQPMSAREERFQGGDLGEEEEEELPSGDSEPPSRMEVEDRMVERLAAEATAGEGEAENMSSDEGGEEGEVSKAVLTEVEQILQGEDEDGEGVGCGRRKRSDRDSESEEEEEDARPAAKRSPRADE